MESPNILRNAYTHEPQQHPNLILGSLQLLFWLFFRPAVWRNHLKGIESTLDTNKSLIAAIKQGQSQNDALWRLFIQSYFILPLLAHLLLGLLLWLFSEPIITIVSWLGIGLGLGITFGVAVDISFTVGVAMTFSVMVIIAFVTALGIVSGVAFSVAVVLALGLAFGVAFSVAGGVASGVAFGMVFSVAFGVVFISLVFLGWMLVLALVVAVSINSWRPVLSFPCLRVWNYLLYILDTQRNANSPCLFRYHSAFWYECQRLVLPDLDEYLLFIIKRNPVEGKAALDYLSTSYQSWAIQAAQIELDAQSLAGFADVEAIRQVHRSLKNVYLESPVHNLLNIFTLISEDVDSALNEPSTYQKRLSLRDATDRLDKYLQELNTSSDKYTIRYCPIAKSWREVIINHGEELAKATELRQEIDYPYIIGVPLTQEAKIFTGRNDIGMRIEELLLDRRRPPLLLYGQRRMGKTSLLYNLGKLLPKTIIPMFVDLQGAPSSANDHAGFFFNLAREMMKSAQKRGMTLLPPTREALTKDPFTSFDEWLDQVENTLGHNTALLMLDEFEVLDSVITKGRFDEQDVLGMLRHLIQHRLRFKVLLAGSHTIEEYQRWASYLINVQVVHISYLKEAEARQLIERPVKDFTLRYEPDAVERVLQLTHCHPFLVQLLCREIITLKNEQDPSMRGLVNLFDVEAAIPVAFKNGSFFFADIYNQVDDNGRAILRFIAAQGEGAIALHETLSQQFPHAATSRKLLLQRELIEEVGEGDRFQVELIRRWFTLDR